MSSGITALPLKRGDRFLHTRIITDTREPRPCVVTAIRYGCIYYRCIYTDENGVESFGGHAYFKIEDAAKWAGERLPRVHP